MQNPSIGFLRWYATICFLLSFVACSEHPTLEMNREASVQESDGEAGLDVEKNPNGMPSTAEPADAGVEPGVMPAPSAPPTIAPATGSLTVAFTPVRYPEAVYAAYVYAVWVTDSGGRYVKTLGARAATRLRFLDRWLTAAGVTAPTQPDGVTGATVNYPAAAAPIAVSWDMKDRMGNFVPRGNYLVHIQLTSSNNPGVSLTVPVSIDAMGITKTDTTMPTGITAVEAKHIP